MPSETWFVAGLQAPVEVSSGALRGWPLPAAGDDKEARGRTLVVGGTTRTPGAVLLAAEAALRSGAGKLQVATVASVAPHLAIAIPEALVVGLPETPEGAIDPSAADEVLPLAADASAVLVGPGMAGMDETCDLVESVVRHGDGPLVLDAMGLALLSRDPSSLGDRAARTVLTPNLAELGHLLGCERAEVDENPLGAVAEVVRRTRAVVSGGGAESWTVSPSGGVWRDRNGGSGLAVSGSGDVLAGIVVGLAARGASPEQAAVWGTHLHKRAGDRLAASVGPLGFLARELPPEVPRVLLEIAV